MARDGVSTRPESYSLVVACLVSSEKVHDGDGSGDCFEREQRCHGDHSSTSVDELRLSVSFLFLWGKLLLQSQVVKVHVTRGLGRLSSEVVTGMSNTLTLSDHDESKDSSEPGGLFCGKNSKSLTRFGFRESIEVKSKTQSTLLYSINIIQNC